jgi:hypothetical protein
MHTEPDTGQPGNVIFQEWKPTALRRNDKSRIAQSPVQCRLHASSSYRGLNIHPLFFFKNIKIGGFEKLLSNLNLRKASGPDEIPTRLLKELPFKNCTSDNIPNATVSTYTLPKTWKDAWITSIFKKGAGSDPASYCSISFTSIVCKFMEHFLYTHISKHLDDQSIFTITKHGFWSRHSCETQILHTTHDLMKQHDLKRQVDVEILDFNKEFDTVLLKQHICKLRIHGLEGEI